MGMENLHYIIHHIAEPEVHRQQEGWDQRPVRVSKVCKVMGEMQPLLVLAVAVEVDIMVVAV